MPYTLDPNVIITITLLASFGLSYIIYHISPYTKSNTSPIQLPPLEDISSTTNTISEITDLEPDVPEHPLINSDEQPDSTVDLSTKTELVNLTGSERRAFNYRHELWPSPRPINFVKALVKGDHIQIEGRLTHGKAIEILSNRANMYPEQFMRVDPVTYTKKFMPHQYNAAVLLGRSIQNLEDTVRRHQKVSMNVRYSNGIISN
jgi:hypothetical protein